MAHRTTTVKCSKGHVRHATASEQLPLGPMLDALRAPPVPPGRDMQASEDLFVDLDERQSKRPHDTPNSSTQQFDFANPDEFVQRAQYVSVPLPITLEQSVPAPETPFQPVPHGNVAPDTPQLSVPSTPPFQCFPGGETAPVTSFSVLVSRPMPSTFAVPSTLPVDSVVTTEVSSTLLPDSVVAHSHADPVVAHDRVPTQFDEESAVDTQSDDPFQFDDPPVHAPVILSQSNPVYDHRDDLPHHIRTQLQSRIRKPAQNLEPDAKRLRLDAGARAVLMLSHDVSSGPECCKPVTIFKSCENSGCADVLLTRRAANKEVQYDALVKSQQVRVDAAMVREWDKCNEFGVTKFLSKKQLNDIMKRNPERKSWEPDGCSRRRPSRASQTTRLDLSFKGVKRTRATSGQMRSPDRETPSS